MLISYNWINEYFNQDLPDPQTVADALTMHAYEVEEVRSAGDDTLLDIDVLPNRAGDSLSHIGVAREVSALFDMEADFPLGNAPTDADISTAENIDLKIQSEHVRRGMKRLVVDLAVEDAPEKITKRLHALGQKSINNIVDITNYVMLETGQPVHAFDYDKIAGDTKNIRIRGAKEGETIETLDGDEYELQEGMLVIADEEKPLDIAGIKGGASSGIDDSTSKVVLSVCSFDPEQIRTTSRRLNLRTDASKRFENDPSPELPEVAMERLSALIARHAGGCVAEDTLDTYPRPDKTPEVTVSREDVNNLLGVDIAADTVERILDSLSCTWEKEGEDYVVEPPYWRRDIIRSVDVVEEIGRVFGYENIEATTPTPVHDTPRVNKAFYYIHKIRDILTSEGFSEVYTRSFAREGDIELENPSADDMRFLRTNLSDNLAEAIRQNKKHSPLLETDTIDIFEIGTVFTADEEHRALAIGSTDSERLKNAYSALRNLLNVPADAGDFDEIIELNLSEIIADLPAPDAYDDLASIDTDTTYEPFSRYPYVLRDIAVWLPNEYSKDDLIALITDEAGEWLVQHRQFDEYAPEGGSRTSYAFRLVFQSDEKTLSDAEVNEVMEDIYDAIEEEQGWEVR